MSFTIVLQAIFDNYQVIHLQTHLLPPITTYPLKIVDTSIGRYFKAAFCPILANHVLTRMEKQLRTRQKH